MAILPPQLAWSRQIAPRYAQVARSIGGYFEITEPAWHYTFTPDRRGIEESNGPWHPAASLEEAKQRCEAMHARLVAGQQGGDDPGGAP